MSDISSRNSVPPSAAAIIQEIVHRSGERAFDVTEKFSLDHRLWERSAIELHHRLSARRLRA